MASLLHALLHPAPALSTSRLARTPVASGLDRLVDRCLEFVVGRCRPKHAAWERRHAQLVRATAR